MTYRRPLIIAAVLVAAATGAAAPQEPQLHALRAEELARARSAVRDGSALLRPALDRLVADADAALRVAPLSVMDKKRMPPSGDRHDYMSMGPYWWPDTTKPNGLPYIRRDGQRNPEVQNDYDSPRLKRVLDAVHTLALAFFFTDNEAYARHAAGLLRTWFLDPGTRMNPNLNFAQAIPGITQGRGIGIIDTNGLPLLLDDIALLRRSPSWTTRDEDGMRAWMTAFLDWLRTSRNGQEEAAAENNHGSWYDAQVAAIALFVGRPELAREVIEASKTRRIARQITGAGDQPLELARTRSLSYSAFNLRALMQLAELGRKVGVDLWHYEAPSGGSIRKALDRLAPYAEPGSTWAGQQITPVEPLALFGLLRMGELAYGDARYAALISKLPPQLVRAGHLQLLYPPRHGGTEQVLIVMDERVQMEALARYLKEKGGVESTIVDQKSLPADWSRFAAVIGYVHGALQEATELKLIDYTKQGGRFICLHHMISSGKAANRYYFDFLGVRLPDPEKAREPAQPGAHYSWRHDVDLTVVNLNPTHYITTNGVSWPDRVKYRSSDEPSAERDYPAFTLEGAEVYTNVQFTDGREKTVLLGFKYLEDRNGALFMQDREGWLKRSGNGWIVYLQMGHTTSEFEHPAVAQMVLNAVTWQPSEAAIRQ